MRPISIPNPKNALCIIRTNYGDDSLALTQWAYEAGLKNVIVVYIDTGFAANAWQDRILLGSKHAKRLGFQLLHITASITFEDAVLNRGHFPTKEMQWCSGLLKGLPFLDWLDTVDVRSESIVLIAKRNEILSNSETLSSSETLSNSKILSDSETLSNSEILSNRETVSTLNINEWISSCPFHGDRTVWHPLFNHTLEKRNALLERAGFSPCYHRSLECEPCVNGTLKDKMRMSKEDLKRLNQLEEKVGALFFETNDAENPRDSQHYLRLFYRGCGNHFGCGL